MTRTLTSRRAWRLLITAAALLATLPALRIGAQDTGKDPAKGKTDKPQKEKKHKDSGAFFSTEEPLEVTLTTNIKRIRGDKGEKKPWRPATISYTGPDGKQITVPTEIKTRGIWRLHNCEFPPVTFNFKSVMTKETVFSGLDKPHLVSYCRDDDRYEQFIIEEYQLYRVYNLLTPISHRARLLHMTYVDSASGKVLAKRAAFLLEEPSALVTRVGGTRIKEKGAGPDFIEPHINALVGVFQYFIGNTDFSIFALHNIEVMSMPNGDWFAVPYDFDFSGVINTPYATVDPKLRVTRVRDRLFRGYCNPPDEYKKVFDLFREKKDSIYALYHDPIGSMLHKNIVDETLDYYNDFYKTINNPRDANSEIVKACITGH
jgi:hypothetical protein